MKADDLKDVDEENWCLETESAASEYVEKERASEKPCAYVQGQITRIEFSGSNFMTAHSHLK